MATNTINDFFTPEENQFRKVKALGMDFFEIDGNRFAKLYQAVPAQSDDQNRVGIIPQTLTIKPELIDTIKRVDSWPTVLECEIVSVPGSKNKTSQLIVAVRGVGLGSDKPQPTK